MRIGTAAYSLMGILEVHGKTSQKTIKQHNHPSGTSRRAQIPIGRVYIYITHYITNFDFKPCSLSASP